MIERVKSVDRDDVDAWQNALQESSGMEVNKLDLVMFLANPARGKITNTLFKDNKFQKNISKIFIRRIQLLPKLVITDWQLEMAKITNDDLDPIKTIVYLIQLDRLFPQEQFSKKESAILLARLKGLVSKNINGVEKALEDVARSR